METQKKVFFCSVCELLSLPENYALLWAAVWNNEEGRLLFMLEYLEEDGVQWMESSVQLYCWHWWHFVAVCIYSIKCFFITTTMKISLFFQWPWKFFGEHCENCIKSGQKRAFTAWNIPSLHKLGDLMPLPSENTKTKVEASWNGRKHWERLQIFLVSSSKWIKVTMECIWRKILEMSSQR